jgi:hypothetical protein
MSWSCGAFLKIGFTKYPFLLNMLPFKNDICFGVLRKPSFEVASVVRSRIDVFADFEGLSILIAFCLGFVNPNDKRGLSRSFGVSGIFLIT